MTLARFLEQHALFFDVPIPYLWLTEHAHPPTELRLGRLASAHETLRASQAPMGVQAWAPRPQNATRGRSGPREGRNARSFCRQFVGQRAVASSGHGGSDELSRGR